jgi:hypothetical protein
MKKFFTRKSVAAIAVLGASTLLLSACSSSDDAGGDRVGVSLILREQKQRLPNLALT